MNLLHELRERFRRALSTLTEDVEPYLAMIRPAQDPRFGDYQANMAMPLAKPLKQPPREVAARIVESLDVVDLCEPPEIAGPGFINLRLRVDRMIELASRARVDERLGHQKVASPKRIVLDYSSPNVAKPMHVGHLRSTVIGNALDRMLRFVGHDVISDNHIGDWGTQFGMIIYGYKHFLDRDHFERAPVEELARLYRLVNTLCDYFEARQQLPVLEQRLRELEQNEAPPAGASKAEKKARAARQAALSELREQIAAQRRKIEAVESDARLRALAEEHPDIVAASRRETARLHQGDPENLALWKQFLPLCLEALQKVYDRLGIRFDLTLGESFYQPMLAGVVEELLAKGIATESEGAICVFVEGRDAPFIIRKADGAYTYATTDLATIRYRVEELKAQASYYVVDARQSEHFELLFAVAARWGYDEIDLKHIRFGTVLGQDRRPFKTRSGDTVGLESLLDEAVQRARAIVDQNDDAKPDGPELSEEERQQVAERVGIGGIKYADLRHNRESDYVFDWDKMLALRGDTATYIQYAYARIAGIFRKGGVARDALPAEPSALKLTHDAERALLLQLLRFPEAVDGALVDHRPNVLTGYLFETANLFTAFYDACPVAVEDDPAVRTSRFLLCDHTARVLKQGLALLGIETCERM